MPIFSAEQKRQLRALRYSMKVLGELDSEQPDPRNWQAAAGQARAALTIVQQAVGLTPIDAAVNVEWGELISEEVIETEVEVTAAEAALGEVFEQLYNQIVAQVEALEALAAEPPVDEMQYPDGYETENNQLVAQPSQVNVTEQPLQDSDDSSE